MCGRSWRPGLQASSFTSRVWPCVRLPIRFAVFTPFSAFFLRLLPRASSASGARPAPAWRGTARGQRSAGRAGCSCRAPAEAVGGAVGQASEMAPPTASAAATAAVTAPGALGQHVHQVLAHHHRPSSTCRAWPAATARASPAHAPRAGTPCSAIMPSSQGSTMRRWPLRSRSGAGRAWTSAPTARAPAGHQGRHAHQRAARPRCRRRGPARASAGPRPAVPQQPRPGPAAQPGAQWAAAFSGQVSPGRRRRSVAARSAAWRRAGRARRHQRRGGIGRHTHAVGGVQHLQAQAAAFGQGFDARVLRGHEGVVQHQVVVHRAAQRQRASCQTSSMRAAAARRARSTRSARAGLGGGPCKAVQVMLRQALRIGQAHAVGVQPALHAAGGCCRAWPPARSGRAGLRASCRRAGRPRPSAAALRRWPAGCARCTRGGAVAVVVAHELVAKAGAVAFGKAQCAQLAAVVGFVAHAQVAGEQAPLTKRRLSISQSSARTAGRVWPAASRGPSSASRFPAAPECT
jgi:hypothetical protein